MTTLLIAAAFVAAAISGAVGFGGALLMLPILNHTVGIEAAVPILAITQTVGNGARVALNWRCVVWRPVLLFSAVAVPAAAIAALFFTYMPAHLLTRLVGGAILVFIALDLSGKLKLKPSMPLLLVGGGVTGIISGLVGSAGPLGAAVFFSLKLAPLAYIASDAMAALLIHGAKALTYGAAQNGGSIPVPLVGSMSIAMVVGTWAGKAAATRISPTVFRNGVVGVMICAAISMIVLGE